MSSGPDSVVASPKTVAGRIIVLMLLRVKSHSVYAWYANDLDGPFC